MKFSKQKILLMLFVPMVLVACGGQTTKQQGDESVVVIRKFDLDDARVQSIPREQFGPNPYLETATDVPQEAIDEYRAAMSALKAEQFKLAEKRLIAMVEKYLDLSGPAYNLAILKKEQGDDEAAEKYLDLAIKRNYANLDARNLRATWLRDQGEFDMAEQEYLAIIDSWGGYELAYRNLGILYDLYMGRHEEAWVLYRQYNTLLPESDRQIQGWIVDLERRFGFKVPEQQAPAAAPEAVDASSAEASPES